MDSRYEFIISFLNDNENLLRRNDFQKLFQKIDRRNRGTLFDFCLNELGINPLKYMNSITEYMFYGSTQAGLNIPNNIKTINNYVFRDCNIKKITIDSNNIDIDSDAFYASTSIEEIEITGNITKLPKGVFASAYNLKKVILPDTLTSIGAKAFPDNSDLIIIVPFKDANKLRVPRNEIPWYREHLRHRHAKLNMKVDDTNNTNQPSEQEEE